MSQTIPNKSYHAMGNTTGDVTKLAVSYTPDDDMTLRHWSFIAMRLFNTAASYYETLNIVTEIEWEIRTGASSGNKPNTTGASVLKEGSFDWRYTSAWRVYRPIKFTINLATPLELTGGVTYWFILKMPNNERYAYYPLGWVDTYVTGASGEVDDTVYSSEFVFGSGWDTGDNAYNLTLYILNDQAGETWHVVVDGEGYIMPDKMRGYRCEQAASGLAQSRGGQSEWSQLRYPYSNLSQDGWLSGSGELDKGEDEQAFLYAMGIDTTIPHQAILGPALHLTGIETTNPAYEPASIRARHLPDPINSRKSSGAARFFAQKFTAPSGGMSLTTAGIRISRMGWQRKHGVSLAIYSDVSGPDTKLAGWADFTDSSYKWAWRDVSLLYRLESETDYWLVVATSQIWGTLSEYRVMFDQNGSAPGGAAMYSKNGTDWSNLTGYSMCFRTNYGATGDMNGVVSALEYGTVGGSEGFFGLAGKKVYQWNETTGYWEDISTDISGVGVNVLTHVDSDDQGDLAYGVWGDGTYIYLANHTGGLHVYSVDAGGTLTHVDSDDQGDNAFFVWGDGDFIYLANDTGGLHVYSVDSEGTLTHVDFDDQGDQAQGVWGDGNFIYLANHTGGLHVYSVDGSGTLTHVDSDDQGGIARSVWGDSNFIYIANDTLGLLSYSVDDEGTLTYIDADDQGDQAFSVWGDGDFIYLANQTGGLLTYSVDEDGILTFIDSDDQGDNALCVWGDSTFIYLANQAGGLHVYSVDTNGVLTYIDTDDQGDEAWGVWGDGDFIYLGNNTGGLHTYAVVPITTLVADGTDLLCFNDCLFVAQGLDNPIRVYDGTNWISADSSELVTNGGFASATTGWTANDAQCTLSSESGGQSGNCLKVLAGDATWAYGYQEITVVADTWYEFRAYHKNGGGTAENHIKIGTAADDDTNWHSGGLDDAAWTEYVKIFKTGSAQTTAVITLIASDENAAYGLFDTVTLEAAPVGKYFHIGQGYMWTNNAVNTIVRSNTGFAWSADITIGEDLYDITAFVNFQGRFLVGKEDGLWEVTNDLALEYWIFRSHAAPDNCKGMTVWSGMLFVPVQSSVWRWQGSQYRVAGPTDKSAGPTKDWPNKVSRLSAVPSMLLATTSPIVSGGFNGLLAYNGLGWHHLTMGTRPYQDSNAIYVTTEIGTDEIRIWFGEGNRITYVIYPTFTDNRYDWTDADYEVTSGCLVSSWWDGGLKDALKFWNRLTMIADIPNDTSIEVYCARDGGDWNETADFIMLGEVTNQQLTDNGEYVLMFPDGMIAKTIQPIFILKTEDSTKTPRLRAFNIESAVRQIPVYTYTFRILLASNVTKLDGTTDTRSAEDMWEGLRRAASKNPPIVVSFPDKSFRGMISYLNESTGSYKPRGMILEEWERVAVLAVVEAT